MAANANELALRYLLRLSSDIAAVVLLREDGELLAGAPHPADDLANEAALELMRSALELRSDQSAPIELDVLCERESVLVLAKGGLAMVCVASRLALPGIVLHEMRLVLSDLVAGGDLVARGAA